MKPLGARFLFLLLTALPFPVLSQTIIPTFAGGGPATAAKRSNARGVVVDNHRNRYIADTENQLGLDPATAKA